MAQGRSSQFQMSTSLFFISEFTVSHLRRKSNYVQQEHGVNAYSLFVLFTVGQMLTPCAFPFQFCVAASILNYLLPKGSLTKWVVAAGLINISEFAFVLGSRAKRFGLITREVI